LVNEYREFDVYSALTDHYITYILHKVYIDNDDISIIVCDISATYACLYKIFEIRHGQTAKTYIILSKKFNTRMTDS
jgi:hypothetical protein